MRNFSSVKREFLRKWITGLRKYSSQKKNMSLLERKKAIKLCADLAMASTRDETTRWSRVLIANASRDDSNKVLTEHMLGSPQHLNSQKVRENFTNSSTRTTSSPLYNSRRRIRSRKIVRRSRTVQRTKERVTASFIAKRLLQKRTRRLKSLLPGGEFMDDVSLLEETLDYIQSLRAQVEVMGSTLLTASHLIKIPS